MHPGFAHQVSGLDHLFWEHREEMYDQKNLLKRADELHSVGEIHIQKRTVTNCCGNQFFDEWIVLFVRGVRCCSSTKGVDLMLA